MRFGIPAVKAPYDSDGLGVRRPDIEPRAFDAFVDAQMTAQTVIKTKVASFVEQVQIAIAQNRHAWFHVRSILVAARFSASFQYCSAFAVSSSGVPLLSKEYSEILPGKIAQQT
jgi:hypothetical protein